MRQLSAFGRFIRRHSFLFISLTIIWFGVFGNIDIPFALIVFIFTHLISIPVAVAMEKADLSSKKEIFLIIVIGLLSLIVIRYMRFRGKSIDHSDYSFIDSVWHDFFSNEYDAIPSNFWGMNLFLLSCAGFYFWAKIVFRKPN